jgi:1,6-anhydro-N-acetylmuramate kinase
VRGQLYLGAISGTSVDGLDLALLSVSQQLRVLAATTEPLPDPLQATLLRLGRPGHDDLDSLGAADAELGAFIGEALLELSQPERPRTQRDQRHRQPRADRSTPARWRLPLHGADR